MSTRRAETMEGSPTLWRSGRREEIQGILLITASMLVLGGVRGGGGVLGRLTGAVLELVGLAVAYPALVLALWGIRRLQHLPAYRSRLELTAWLGIFPLLVTFLEAVGPGSGGRLGFWAWAYARVLLGDHGSGIACAALMVVLVSYCLDVAPRVLFRRTRRIFDRLVGDPLRALARLIWRGLVAFQRAVYVVLRDVWIVVDLIGRRLEGLAEGAGPREALASAGATPLPTPLPGPRAAPSPTPGPEVPPPPVVERGESRPRPPDTAEDPGAEDLLQVPRMARAVSLRRGLSAIPGGERPGAPAPPPRAAPPAPQPAPPQAASTTPEPEASPPGDPADPGPSGAPAESAPTTSSPTDAAPAAPAAAPTEAAAPGPAPEPAPEPEPEPEPGTIAVERPHEAQKRQLRIEARRLETPEKSYQLPPLELFLTPPDDLPRESDEELRRKAELITVTLKHFGIDSTISRITSGPSITQFELVPAAGVKISRITSLTDDLAMSLAVAGVRIEAPIPGRGAVGIEVPNATVAPVYFQELVADEEFGDSEKPLTFVLGKGIDGSPIFADLSKAPHMLVAGATGAGKSVCINTIISSLLTRNPPDRLRFIMVDPKMVELMIYDGIPQLVTPVITDPQAASAALKWAVMEMERRYRVLSRAGFRNIASFNHALEKGKLDPEELGLEDPEDAMRAFPYMVIVIDELADLMMVAAKDIEDSICRLAQMARAVGMHLIVATQRPSTNVITGIIKANLPTRIAFRVASKVDSKVILDMVGAEALLGRGDMLYQPVGRPKPMRIQGAFIQDDEIKGMVRHLAAQEEPEYQDIVAEVQEAQEPGIPDPGDFRDEYLPACIKMAVDKGEVSTSLLQRHFKIGYNRAATIIDVMESRGVVSGAESGRRRKVLIGPSEAATLIASL